MQPQKCWETHPVLSLGMGQLIGGSAYFPPEGVEVSIALERGAFERGPFPWNGGHKVCFPIVDQGVPESSAEFVKMVDWVCKRLQAGAKIHVGCIGGHGRTGLVFAGIAKVLMEQQDAITWVRQHYCPRAVESQRQVDFLARIFGITKAEPRHMHSQSTIVQPKLALPTMPPLLPPEAKSSGSKPLQPSTSVIRPIQNNKKVWA